MSESSGPRVRAGDAERERVVEALRAHHEAGRIDVTEFTERMEAALGARHLDELPALLADLPEPGGGEAAQEANPPHTRSARPGSHPPFVPILLALAVVGSVGAVAHGHFPFPLLWLALLLLWLRPGRRHRWHGGRSRSRA